MDISGDEFSTIQNVEVRVVTEEEMLDFKSTFFRLVTECGTSGRPLLLRLPKGHGLTTGSILDLMKAEISFPYNQQVKKRKENVYSFSRIQPGKGVTEKDYTTSIRVEELEKNHSLPDKFKHLSFQQLEKEYWKQLRLISQVKDGRRLAICAPDVSGSLMSFSSKFSLGSLDTILQTVVAKYASPIPGITLPLLYIGTWLSSYAQQLEEKDLWLASFLHYGAPKVSYVTPAHATMRFEEMVYKELENVGIHPNCTAPLRHKCTLVDPLWYKKNGIPLLRVVQEAGDLMIVPPFCYRFGWNQSFNVSEEVNFATRDWIVQGLLAKECDQACTEELLEMEPFIIECMPERHWDYLSGRLELVHPHDPLKQARLVLPLPVIVPSWSKELATLSSGLQGILAAKVVSYTQYVYAVFGNGEKGWVERRQLDGMFWVGNMQPVIIPDEVFLTKGPIKPHFQSTEAGTQTLRAESDNSRCSIN